ncbi:MAG: TRAP transporter substrate-binding protein [Oscillospiraceae bacterium]|nr:TRAP transporter substrate-binding protein [Oscillospiraceae bacterium]
MKHKMLSAAAAFLLLTGCQSKTDTVSIETESPAETAVSSIEYPVTVRVGYSTGKDDPRGIALDSFKETVESQTNGDILIEIHPSGELGSDSELIAGMISGDVDMTVSSAGNYALYATRVGVSALPFLFEDFESAWNFIDSPEIQEVDDELELYNMHVLAYFDNGFRCVTTSENAGAVQKVSDMEGLNIRTPENQIVMETMSVLHANPRSYPFAELKQALADGEFDAQENPIPVIYNNQLYEVQKYLSVTNHSYDAMPLTIRQELWADLTPEYQSIIQNAAKDAESQNRALVKQQTEDYVKELENVGMKIVYPDLQPFRKATESVMDMFRTMYGEELIAFVTSYEKS